MMFEGGITTAEENDSHPHHMHHSRGHSTSVMIQFRRLLYCMEHHENMVRETSNRDSQPQSWESILLRAQLLQELWQQVNHNGSNDYDDDNDDDHHGGPCSNKDWIGDLEEYQELSQRVDAACHRAREIATMERQRAERRWSGGFGEDNDENNTPVDWVKHIFFDDDHPDDDNDDGVDKRLESMEEEEDLDAILEEEEDDELIQEEHPQKPQRQYFHQSSNHTTNLQELQEAQREQMEHAISLMAKQMKEATQGIHNRIKQQTATTLNELETVAEQNVQEVSEVARNVRNHNISSSRSNWATWTLLLMLVGVFCFTFVTIFTIPKSPNACLLCVAKKDSLARRLMAKAGHGVALVSSKVQEMTQGIFTKDNDGGRDDGAHDRWKSVYEEDSREREEKERLKKLLQNLNSMDEPDAEEEGDKDDDDDEYDGEEYEEEEEEDEEEPDNPWGIKAEDEDRDDDDDDDDDETEKPDNPWVLEAEDDKIAQKEETQPDNPWGLEAEDDKAGAADGNDSQGRRQRHEEIQAQPQNIVSPEEVNMDDLMASLKRKMQETKAAQAEAEASAENAPSASHVGGFDPAAAFQRDGAAAERFSPRDFRVKAATDDYDTLQRYISISTEHINRKDKHGWTALHFATRSGHVRIVRLLLEHGADPQLPCDGGQTPLDVAIERFSPDHPIVNLLQQALHGGDGKNREKVVDEATDEMHESTATEGRRDAPNGDDERVVESENLVDKEPDPSDVFSEEQAEAVEEVIPISDEEIEQDGAGGILQEEMKASDSTDSENTDDSDQSEIAADKTRAEILQPQQDEELAILEAQERKDQAERRKRLMQSVLEDPSDEDEDPAVARSRLDALLKKPPRKSIFAGDEL